MPSQDANPGRLVSESVLVGIRLGQSSSFVLWGLLNNRSWDYLNCFVWLSGWDFWIDTQSPSLVSVRLCINQGFPLCMREAAKWYEGLALKNLCHVY